MFSLYIGTLCTILSYLLYNYSKSTFNYWKLRKIQGPTPVLIFGNIKDIALRQSNTGTLFKKLYDEYPTEKFIGIYRMTSPCLLIRDLDIVKQIMIRDFAVFTDRGIEFSQKYLGANLFHANEKIWRPLRTRFTPLFTTNKLKNMVYLIVEKGDIFIDYVNTLVAKQTEQNVHALMQKYTISTISACAFGLDVDIDDSKNTKTLNKIDKLIFSRNFMREFGQMFPSALKIFNLSVFPEEVVHFFRNLVNDVIQARNGKPSDRKDFMDLILELRQQAKAIKDSKDENFLDFTDEVVTAQAFAFYAAGYETSATTMEYMLYELAMNPEIQDKLIVEIDDALVKCNGKVVYDTISKLSYMEKVFDETLRKYPIVEPLQRVAKTDYNIPGTDVTVNKGQIVIISPLAIHRDEKYYPNPETFDPERFSAENVMGRHPCAYLPFGLGPRNCIGLRFAKIQTRICLMKLFSKFQVRPSENTPKTIIFDPYRLVLSSKDNLMLNLIPRNDVKHST